MNRRDFLLKTTLAGTALLTSTNANALSILPGKKPKSVIIIGAGFAGLSAGLYLKKAGVQITILEARNRIGGRVFSYQPQKSPGNVIELGAEWVGESHTRIIELCNEFNLNLLDNRFETDLVKSGKHTKTGQWALSEKAEQFWKDKVTIWENMSENEKKSLDKTDWWRFLLNHGFSQEDLFLRDLVDSTDFGESIRHTSAYAAFAEYAESSEKNEMDFKIEGGNTQLIEKMADAIGRENIKLDYAVKQVDQKQKNKVVLTCQNGTTFETEKIICALPTRSVMNIDWRPGLPSDTMGALNELQYSRIGKFPVVFSEKFWKRDNFDMITDTPAHYFYHGTKNQSGKGGVLMCYATGDKADVLASVGGHQRKEIILNALQPAFGNVKKYIRDDFMYYWGQDNYSLGAYAFYGKDQWFTVMPQIKKNHLHTFFAGEHLADWQGFMEGAINSGEEAALQILEGN